MHQTTRDTYDRSANSLSRHYDHIGSRDGDINLAFTMAGNPVHAQVFEIGCGNGRDATIIADRAASYTGIDTSKEMVAIAQTRVPDATFSVADAVQHDYGGPYDIVFAFALFRHMIESEVRIVLAKIADSLKPGGIVYISSPYGLQYYHAPHHDEFGVREMYYYNPAILQKYSPDSLKKVHELYDAINGAEWFEVAFRKQPVHS